MCENKVTADYRRDGTPILIKCGSWWAGEQCLCDSCTAKFNRLYPQGWKYYPGDVCPHGYYVGGSGIDYMCPICESQ